MAPFRGGPARSAARLRLHSAYSLLPPEPRQVPRQPNPRYPEKFPLNGKLQKERYTPAATATIGAGSTKVAFGAISTGIVGAKASFDKHALINQALPTLVAQMVAQRESIRATIRGSQDLPVDSYTLYAGLSDLGRFERAGSIPGSLQSIAEDAGQKAATARQQLRDVRTAKFIKTTAGDLLRKFWKPDGKTINTENKGKLEAWMKKNLIATAPGSITMFLRSEVLEDARIQAVKELGLVKEQ